MNTFSIGIPHTPWVPERVETLERLLYSLELYPDDSNVKLFTERLPNHVWSEHMWKWGSVQKTTHFLSIQDDAIVSDLFWSLLEDIVVEFPNDIIGLQVAHPVAKIYAQEHKNWFTTCDGLVGVGYCLPTSLLREFLEWRSTCLKEGAIETISEDSLLGLFAMCTGRRIHHPIPTIVDHDTSILSTYGNEGHSNRRSAVFASSKYKPNSYDVEIPIPHIGRLYTASPKLALDWVKNTTSLDVIRYESDNGESEHRRLRHFSKSRGKLPDKKLLICTPTRGAVHPEYAASVWGLLRAEAFDVDLGFEVFDAQLWSDDIVRCRSKFVHHFLTQTDCTHLLFIDSDISFSPRTIINMLNADRHFVAAPYPRRDSIDFDRVKSQQDIPVEAAAYRYSIRVGSALSLDSAGCGDIEGIGLGCALLSREMLQDVTNLAHKDGRQFLHSDLLTNKEYTVANLFALETVQGRLLSEDYSFCELVRGSGYKVEVYLGDGSPVSHHGSHAYHGVVESFGYKRMKP